MTPALVLALLAVLPSTALADLERLHRQVAQEAEVLRSAANRVPSGRYELEAAAGGRAFSAELELLAVEGRPWGRLTVGAVGVVTAVRGIAADGDTWTFAAGGPVRRVRLTFAAEVSGTLELGDGPPITLTGRRAGDVVDPGALRAHHVLDPLGLAVRAGEEGASFPTGTPEGHLIFARHGPDLSGQTLMIADPVGAGWGQPEVMALSGTHSDRSPAVLPDGSGLVFASDRPNDGGGESGQYRLWFAPRLDSGAWGAPRQAELAGGWPHDARQPSVTADGSLYFSSDAAGGSGEGDLYAAAQLAPGHWSAPRNVGAPVNSEHSEHGAFVAPDGSYMVLTSSRPRPSRQGDDDLWVSFPTGDGWSDPIPLPLPVNTFANEYGAWVSPVDGRLYFTSDRYGYAALFRVDADVIRVPPAPSNSGGVDQEPSRRP